MTDPRDSDEAGPDGDPPENDGSRFDRLPATADDRVVPGRATREEVIDWWVERFGLDSDAFDPCTFWELGDGKVWILHGDAPNPSHVEAQGMVFLRTRQEHWKPTTDAVQRFGTRATRSVIDLTTDQARRFAAGDTQEVEWDGDWGYLIVAHELAGDRAVLGVGLFTYGELKSMIPKGRRRSVPADE